MLIPEELVLMSTPEQSPQQVLVVIPHPGDAEFWCSGTVAKWVGEGATVRYVLCTDGDRGAVNPETTSEELKETRRKEQAEAAALLGVQELVHLCRSDGGLEDTAEFRKELVRQVRQMKPDTVLCPEPNRKNLAWHRDHRIAGQVAMDAVFPYGRDHLHFEELWRDEGLEPHKTGTVLFWGAENPDTVIDISGSIGAKLKALKVHRSQFTGRTGEEVEAMVKGRALEAADCSEFQSGEAFRKVTFRT